MDFLGHDVACVSLFWNQKSVNNKEKFSSFKSKETFHQKEVGPYRGFRLSQSVDRNIEKVSLFLQCYLEVLSNSYSIPG